MKTNRLLAIIATAMLTACTTTQEVNSHNTPVSITSRIAVALVTQYGTRLHSATGRHGEKTFSGECVIKCDAQGFTAVFMAPHARLLTLRITPPDVINVEKSPFLPDNFTVDHVLLDMAVVNLPLEKLRAALGNGYTVNEKNGIRQLILNGQIVETCDFPDGTTIRLTNHRYNYEYTLTPLKQ